MSSRPQTLPEILSPLSTSEFTQKFLGKQFFYSPGERGRFSALLPWADLNQILRTHRLDHPRLRLVMEGKPVPVESYLTRRVSRRAPYVPIPRVRPAEMTRQLRDGATLVLDSVDELQEPISQLAEDIEKKLRMRIQVNMYAGWRHSRGFDLHWDDHDVLILQISGRKHWKVYPMTRSHPLAGDRNPDVPETVLWEGLLEDGDLLYIPRGWWHVALPLDEPTLHLTVGLHGRNGVDFLSWFSDRLRHRSAVIRQDLPRFATSEEQQEYLQKVQQAFLQEWHSGLLDEYFKSSDARAESRPVFAFPWSALPGVVPPEASSWSLRWVGPIMPKLDKAASDGILHLEGAGKRWKFAGAARPLLNVLLEKRICTLEDLQAVADGAVSPEIIRRFVRELSEAGLVASIPDESVP